MSIQRKNKVKIAPVTEMLYTFGQKLNWFSTRPAAANKNNNPQNALLKENRLFIKILLLLCMLFHRICDVLFIYAFHRTCNVIFIHAFNKIYDVIFMYFLIELAM